MFTYRVHWMALSHITPAWYKVLRVVRVDKITTASVAVTIVYSDPILQVVSGVVISLATLAYICPCVLLFIGRVCGTVLQHAVPTGAPKVGVSHGHLHVLSLRRERREAGRRDPR